ncbi:MAG: phosphodiester glycosidase family protein [Verrucomicrobia bacterium]|nr:phosphodiester glycosidase family protein [Verrucomicrobiota bacterium]
MFRLWGIGLFLIAAGWYLRPEARLSPGDIVTEPFDGVRHVHRVVDVPRRIDMHFVILDLHNPQLRFQVTGDQGGEPGSIHRETTRHFVGSLRAQIGINGGFFDYYGNSIALSASNGRRISPWHPTEKNHNNGVNISRENQVTFISRPENDLTGFATEPPVELYNAFAGNVRLLTAGKMTARHGGDTTYPQTALGWTADNHLILFVADGRQPEISHGMTYEEVAYALQEFGAVDAIALDGGGSATLVMADTFSGAPRVVNHPSDGRERPVGNSLAVFAAPSAREPDPK